MTSIQNPCCKAALYYSKQGWYSLPLTKAFIPCFKEWPTKLSLDEETIKGWFTNPYAVGVGIVTGKLSGLIVLCLIDVPNSEVAMGMSSLRDLETQYGQLPPTVTVETGNGELHYFFSHPGNMVVSSRIGRTKLRPGIEVLADGNHKVNAPPSVASCGKPYRFREGHSPNDLPLAEIPDWLLRLINDGPEKRQFYFASVQDLKDFNQEIGDGTGREEFIYTAAVTLYRKFRWSEESIVDFLLDKSEQLLKPPHTRSYIESKVRQVIRSTPKNSRKGTGTQSQDEGKFGFTSVANAVLACHTLLTTNSQLAQGASNAFHRYTGQHWSPLSVAELEQIVLDDHFPSANRAFRNEVVSYIAAKTYRRNIPWNDISPTEVPFPQGVFDLKTGQTRPHRPEDYLESVVPHRFDKTADCPRWKQCLDEWFAADTDKTEKIHALQEFFGYALLPHARFKKTLVCLGPPHTGKTEVQKVMTAMVGVENTCSIPIQRFDKQSEVYAIKGKRLNLAGELNRSLITNADAFKRFVSTGEPVQLNGKFRDAETYTPHCKHAFFTNEFPVIHDNSGATHERLLVIQFEHEVPVEKRDPSLEAALQGELPGIMAWALEGAKRLIENSGRFTIPQSSVETVRELKNTSNPVQAFFEDHCVPTPSAHIYRDDFIAVFRAFNPDLTPEELTDRNLSYKINHCLPPRNKIRPVHFRGNQKHRAIPGYQLKYPSYLEFKNIEGSKRLLIEDLLAPYSPFDGEPEPLPEDVFVSLRRPPAAD